MRVGCVWYEHEPTQTAAQYPGRRTMPNVTSLRPDDPRRVGRYRLTGRVDEFAGGEAGPAAVFLAQRVDGEPVMVTLLAGYRADDAAARDRFSAEARVARRVPPFCVAKILDAGFEGGRPYLITESVPGATLAQIVALEGPLPAATLRALAIGCVTGIASIHQAGLVHGQFGPGMVVLGREGPRVVHFSITPPYGAATPAADMLAWARTILFAAVGRPSLEHEVEAPDREHEVDALRHVGDPPRALAARHLGQRAAPEADLAPRGSEHASEDAQQTRLPGAVLPQHGDDLAGRDRRVQAVEGAALAVARRESARLDQGRRGSRARRPWLPRRRYDGLGSFAGSCAARRGRIMSGD